MSLLAPLYFVAALAIGLPILFHLIRQRPKQKQTFSSLMFLQPSPPRLTRRSRLDDWWLLLMRALALLLVVAAFARPFLRTTSTTTTAAPGRDVLLLVDTSASMRQDGVWEAALNAAQETLQDLEATDRVGLIAFDKALRTLVDVSDADSEAEVDGKSAVSEALQTLQPTWHATDLGLALTSAADQFNQWSGEATASKRIVLISDMQQGAATERLQGYQWPRDIVLKIVNVAKKPATNAGLSIMPSESAASTEREQRGAATGPRVRVTNSLAATDSQFELRWVDAKTRQSLLAQPNGSTLPNVTTQTKVTAVTSVNVPPGETRVVTVPLQPDWAVGLQLIGDDEPFDNLAYVAPVEPIRRRLLYVGSAPADPRDSLPFYLERAPLDSPTQRIVFERVESSGLSTALAAGDDAAFVVIGPPYSVADASSASAFAEKGGSVLCVLSETTTSEAGKQAVVFLNAFESGLEDDAADVGDATSGLTSGTTEWSVSEATKTDFSLMVDINFRDPLFAIFAEPQFSDFSKIRFWSHRVLEPPGTEWQVAAKFDDGNPAIIRRVIGDGECFVLAAGWQPSVSQLAMSTKFLPLIARMIDASAGESTRATVYFAGDRVPEECLRFEVGNGPEGWSWSKAAASDASPPSFGPPGRYTFSTGDERLAIAVNLATAESDVASINDEAMERYGVPIRHLEPSEAELADRERQKQDRELEDTQQWWRWLVLSALGLMLVETWWAGRKMKRQAK